MDVKTIDRIRLQEFMDRKGLKQQGLADLIGVKRELIAAWNTGRSDVTRENISKLIAVGMYPEEIFGDEVASLLQTKSAAAGMKQEDPVATVIKGLEGILQSLKK